MSRHPYTQSEHDNAVCVGGIVIAAVVCALALVSILAVTWMIVAAWRLV